MTKRKIRLRSWDNPHGPIRSYRQTVEAMRAQGDSTITIQQIHYYEKKALRKLAVALEEYKDYLE